MRMLMEGHNLLKFKKTTFFTDFMFLSLQAFLSDRSGHGQLWHMQEQCMYYLQVGSKYQYSLFSLRESNDSVPNASSGIGLDVPANTTEM